MATYPTIQKTDFTAMRGGLDLVSQAVLMPPGRAIGCLNYEPVAEGYRRIGGFERMDGRPAPSRASYSVLRFRSGSTIIEGGEVVTGDTSGATGVALYDPTVESGDWDTADAAGYIVLTDVSGGFQNGEGLTVAGKSRSNLALYSEDWTESPYLDIATASTSLSTSDGPNPDGIDEVSVIGDIDGTQIAGRAQDFAITENVVYASSVFLRQKTSGRVAAVGMAFFGGSAVSYGLAVDLATGHFNVASTIGAAPINVRVVDEENGWWRIEMAGNSGAGNDTLRVSVRPSYAATLSLPVNTTAANTVGDTALQGEVLAWGLQVEAGPSSTAYMKTEGSPISAQDIATANGPDAPSGATTDSDDALWKAAAIERRRTPIEKPPGSGPVRGVWIYKGDRYAFRDDAGGTACIMHKATPTGWQAQSFGRYLDFSSGGTYEIKEGDLITGAASGATATVERIGIIAGTWGGGNALGVLTLSGQTGTFQAENLNVGANSNVATIAGNSDAVALPPGGRYSCANHNFYGAEDEVRMYFANGVGRAHEWDGEVLAPIFTGLISGLDKPRRVRIFKNHLVLSYAGGSVQGSGTGEPHGWAAILGAWEFSIGETITGMMEYAGALVLFARNKVAYLTGDDAQNFVLNPFSDDAGAVEWTAQLVGRPLYLDDRGVRDLSTTDAFGDFRMGTITTAVEPLFRAKRAAGATAVGSLRVRSRDQYWLFWSDGTGIIIYMGGKTAEVMPFDLGMTIACTCSGEDADGAEVLLIGDTEGMVYQLDSGTSFDGQQITAFIRMPFNHCGAPNQIKCWYKVAVEVVAAPTTSLGIVAEFGYANPDQPPVREQAFSVRGGGGFWNEFLWDSFYWSSPAYGTAEAYVDGLGRNISITIVSDATYEQPHVLQGYHVHWTDRGLVR